MITPHILIADDHSIVRLGISLVIQKQYPKACIKQTDNYQGVLDMVAKEDFQLVILDVNMPNGSFQATLDTIKMKQRETRVLVFSTLDEELYAVRYLKAGADGFLQKHVSEEGLKTALEKMMQTGTYISDKVKDALISQTLHHKDAYQNPLGVLSDRELEIARLLITGNGLKEIANKLFVHVATVSTYKSRIYKKLNITSVIELGEVFRLYHL